MALMDDDLLKRNKSSNADLIIFVRESVTGEFSDFCHEKAIILKRKNINDTGRTIVSFITIDSLLN